MEYDSEISMDALNKLLRHFNSKKLANYANGGANDGVDPYANYDGYTRGLMAKATQDPKSLTRRERKYLEQEHGFFPGFDSMGANPDPISNPLTVHPDIIQSFEGKPGDLDQSNTLNYTVHPDIIQSFEGKPGDTYNSNEEITRDIDKGLITQEEGALLIDKLNKQGFANRPQSKGDSRIDKKGRLLTDGPIEDGEINPWNKMLLQSLYAQPSLSSDAVFHHLGRAIGAPKGTKGRGLQIGAGIGKLALSGARGIASGIGYSKVQKEARDWYTKKMLERDRYYTPQPQYLDNNYTGSQSFAKYGGIMKYFEGGMPPTGEPLPVAVQNILRSQDPTGKRKMATFTDPEIFDAAILARSNAFETLNTPQARTTGGPGMGDARILDDFLIKNYKDQTAEYFRNRNNQFSSGVPVVNKYGGLMKYNNGGFSGLGDNAAQLLNLFLQSQNQGTINPNQTTIGNDAGLSELNNPNIGTSDSFQVGQPITFKHGGKKISGTIKEIKNGKIYI